MAIVQNPSTGRSSGKFANAIFQTLFGKTILRSKPIEVYNPKTPGQVAQRTKFDLIVQYFRRILPILRIGFSLQAIGMSAWNAATSTNIKLAITGTSPDFSLDYSKMIIAKGPLLSANVAFMDENTIEAVSIGIPEHCLMTDPEYNDLVYGLFYNLTKDSFMTSMGVQKRSDWLVSVAPELWEAGDVVHGWVFYTSPDGSIISDSVYAGSTTLIGG